MGMVHTHQRLIDQMVQTCYIWGITIVGLAPEVVNMTSRRSIANVCSLDSDKGRLISCMIEGISVIKPEMSPQHLDLVLFYSLFINALVFAKRLH
jgi:hypothetical protein